MKFKKTADDLIGGLFIIKIYTPPLGSRFEKEKMQKYIFIKVAIKEYAKTCKSAGILFKKVQFETSP